VCGWNTCFPPQRSVALESDVISSDNSAAGFSLGLPRSTLAANWHWIRELPDEQARAG
jgi:hypothetical protein